MRMIPGAWRLCAAAMMLGVSSGAIAADDTLSQIKAQIDALKAQDQFKVNSGALVIESWMLTSTAIESTAIEINKAVRPHLEATGAPESVFVLAKDESLDFGQVAMLRLEIESLTNRLKKVCECDDTLEIAGSPIAVAGMVAGLLKSETELTAIEQEVDAKLLAAAVAHRVTNAILLSAASPQNVSGTLTKSFKSLVVIADQAEVQRNTLENIEKKTEAQVAKLARLTPLLARYDSFYTRVTTANDKGVVPLVAAAALQQLTGDKPYYVLRVNTVKGGGTLLKRTNILTALGAESAFISGGLVSSYQLTNPRTGKVLEAGVVTCRTTLTSLKRVQNASWKNSDTKKAEAICSP